MEETFQDHQSGYEVESAQKMRSSETDFDTSPSPAKRLKSVR